MIIFYLAASVPSAAGSLKIASKNIPALGSDPWPIFNFIFISSRSFCRIYRIMPLIYSWFVRQSYLKTFHFFVIFFFDFFNFLRNIFSFRFDLDIMFVEHDLEPQPVKDLYATDDREAGEKSHHPSYPTYLVRKWHLGVPRDLRDELEVPPGRDLSYPGDDALVRQIVQGDLEYVLLSVFQHLLKIDHRNQWCQIYQSLCSIVYLESFVGKYL